jgi:UDP-N-acetylmuramoylalanine--D-glutamate ligase
MLRKIFFLYQNSNGILVVNRENKVTHEFKKEAKGIVKEFSSEREILDGAYYKDGILYVEGKEVCKKDDIIIKGIHNVENYIAAFIATKDDVSVETMK